MSQRPQPSDSEQLRQELAAIEHERWADWQKWCHQIIRGTIASGGSIEEVLTRWDKQIITPYAALSEREQASDMEQVDRYWPLIESWHQKGIAAAELKQTEFLEQAEKKFGRVDWTAAKRELKGYDRIAGLNNQSVREGKK